MQQKICDVCTQPMDQEAVSLDLCGIRCLVNHLAAELPVVKKAYLNESETVIFTPRLNHKTLRALEQLGDVIWDLLNGSDGQKCCSECRFWRSNHGGSAMRCRKTGIEGPFDNDYINDCPYFEGYNTTP